MNNTNFRHYQLMGAIFCVGTSLQQDIHHAAVLAVFCAAFSIRAIYEAFKEPRD